MHKWIVAASALALSCAPALAVNISRVVPAGGTWKSRGFYAINPDCSLVGYPTVRITSPPSNGVATVIRGRDFPGFSPANPRSACNRRRVPAMQLKYRPARGFVGGDSFSIDAIFPDGHELSANYYITVK